MLGREDHYIKVCHLQGATVVAVQGTETSQKRSSFPRQTAEVAVLNLEQFSFYRLFEWTIGLSVCIQ